MRGGRQPRAPRPEDRRLTLIVVPHEDLDTRSFTVSYGRLRLILGALVAAALVFVIMASSWWYVAAQAARVAGLQREVHRLEAERAEVVELAKRLQGVEAQYERVRQLLGADAPVAGKAPVLPPLHGKAGEKTPVVTPGL